MIFQIINHVYSVYSNITNNQQDKIQAALKKEGELRNSPVQIQIHAKDPNTLIKGEEPQIIGTIEPVLQNSLFYIYEGGKALIDLCKDKEVYAVLSCPNLDDDINYKSYFQLDWALQQTIVERVPGTTIKGNLQSPTDAQTRSNLREDLDRGELYVRTGEDDDARREEEAERQREIRAAESQGSQPHNDQSVEDKDGDEDVTHEPRSAKNTRVSAVVYETATKYIVYKSLKSPKSIKFAVYLTPIFSYEVITKPLLPDKEYIFDVSRDTSIPQTILDRTFEYTNTEGELELVNFKYTKAYPDTEKLTSRFFDISLETIYMMMNEGIKNIKQALIPALEVLENMKVRSKIRLCANECPKKKNSIPCNVTTESTKTPCETNTFEGKIWDYNFINTLSKYQISVCSILYAVENIGYSGPAFSHLGKTFDAISVCNTITSIQASIKAHLLYLWSKNIFLEINSFGLLETETFLKSFNFDVSCAESVKEKTCLKQIGCAVQDNSKSKDPKSTARQGTASENEEAEEGDEDNNSDEDTNVPKKKGSNTFLYVSIAVVVVCVTSITVYYVLA